MTDTEPIPDFATATEDERHEALWKRVDAQSREIVQLRAKLERAQEALRECPGLNGDYSIRWSDKHARAICEAKGTA